MDDFELTDEEDHLILMHRDAHFGGDFHTMLTYYQEDGVGVLDAIDPFRIGELALLEEEVGENLAAHMLSASEAEKVGEVRRLYEQLKALYEHDEPAFHLPRVIADLILSEDEDGEEESEQILALKERVIPELIRIVENDSLYDPLFPGYGWAPARAIACLGKLQAEDAIIPLFEALKKEALFETEIIKHALFEIGEAACSFLINAVQSRPLNEDNLQAAYALSYFAERPDVIAACKKELETVEVQKNALLFELLTSIASS